MKNHINTEIGMGSVVKAKVVELEDIIMEGISSRMRGNVVDCVHSVVGKTLLVQLEDEQKKEIDYDFLVFLISKEEVEIYEAFSHFPKK